MPKLILLRHGQSAWNKENRFTGWTDVSLSEKGIEEARLAGRYLLEAGVHPDVCFTSVLKRAIKTLWLVLEEMDLMWLPVERSWRLNERHYGALQGLNKAEMAAKVGEEQVHIWRRSYDIPPPPLEEGDERFVAGEPRYARLDPRALPRTESLKDTVERVLPFWNDRVVPQLRDGRTVIIAAHGNSLRGLVKHLDRIADAEIPGVEIPTGVPLIYELDQRLEAQRHYYLGPEAAAHGH